MVTTFASNRANTPWALSLLSNDKIKQLGNNNPTFDRADLLWQAARCRDEGQNLDLARTQQNMIGEITDIAESTNAPTIAETKPSLRAMGGKGGSVPLDELRIPRTNGKNVGVITKLGTWPSYNLFSRANQ